MNATIHVIDDDEALRDSLRWLLEGHGFRVMAHADAAQFLAASPPLQGCVLLLDVRMPGMTGLQLQDELNRRGVKTPIIFITGHGDVPMAVEAVKKGAFNFIEKPFTDSHLVDLIRRAAQMAQPTVAPGAGGRLQQLTTREREVLERVIAGKLNKSIADELGISIKTVEAHRSRVMEKMQAKSLAELIQLTLAEKAG